MFLGTYSYNIDTKGRISIPSKMRDELGANFVLSRNIANCLEAYPMSEWEKIMEKVNELPYLDRQDMLSFLCAGAQEIELDKQGRFCIPPELREYAGLKDTIKITGKFNTVQFWNDERLDDFNNNKITNEKIISVMNNNKGF